MASVKASIILDTRRAKKDSTYPVKLRVTFERKQQYYPTPYDLTEADFRKTMFGERQTTKEKELKKKIQVFEDKATAVIENLPFFTWSVFEKHYLRTACTNGTVSQFFDEYINALKESGRVGTAVSYKCAQNSLNKFASGAKFRDITPEYLRRYEKWMLTNGGSITTVGIYLRSLRTMFNAAIADGVLPKDFYPFGRRKYKIPTSNNIKKALTLADIEMIYNYKAEPGSMSERAKDYWVFMYLCNGINVKDLCLLKYENIKGDVLEFVRAKTVRTKRNIEPIRVSITDDVKKIISKWGNTNKDGKDYIFPVLEKGITPERERQLVQQLIQVINSYTKAIAKELEITNDVTTYTARHSFATILKRSGVSTEFISEALGHTNVKTTQNYLAGFEDESKKEAIKALTAFRGT